MVTKRPPVCPERRRSCVVVTFAARDGDPYARDRTTGEFVDADHTDPSYWGPTLRALADERSDLRGRVSDLYYLCHPSTVGGRRVRARSAADLPSEIEAAIARHLVPALRPRFHPITWKTDRAPNDHGDLFDLVRQQLRAVRAAHREAEVVLSLSSGTSAMHAVLFLAGSVGVVDGPIRLVQIERGEGLGIRPERPVTDVDFKLETIWKIAQSTKPARNGVDVTPRLGFGDVRTPALKRMLESADRVAPLPFPILLRGERGVGKTTLAIRIRAASPFRVPGLDDAWPSIACGQYSDPNRLYVELCGASRGAYTGLAAPRAGLFETAAGDTIFLDEIHDLNEQNQRAIIRAIEERRFYPLGSDKPKSSRFRLITGTNVSDAELQRRLTPDFLDRIRDIEIEIPPLRACRDDLPWMWAVSWEAVARAAKVEPTVLVGHEELIVSAIAGHDLPGNWRDLRRLAVRLVVAAHAGDLRRAQVERVLREFRSCHVDVPSVILPAPTASRRLTKTQVGYLNRLRESLGTEFERLEAELRAGNETPRVVLDRLLDSRHRGGHAEKFLQRAFPDVWRRLQSR